MVRVADMLADPRCTQVRGRGQLVGAVCVACPPLHGRTAIAVASLRDLGGLPASVLLVPPLPPLRFCTASLSQEIRRIWVGYWSQADPQLGARIAAKLQGRGCL